MKAFPFYVIILKRVGYLPSILDPLISYTGLFSGVKFLTLFKDGVLTKKFLWFFFSVTSFMLTTG